MSLSAGWTFLLRGDQCLYGGQCTIDETDWPALLWLGNKYQLEALKALCSQVFQGSITPGNVCTRLQSNVDNASCLLYIRENASKVAESDDFLNLTASALTKILSSPFLWAREGVVFESIVRWGRNECTKKKLDPTQPQNIRTALGDLVKDINFGLMNMEEFCQIVQPTNILTADELLECFRFLASPSNATKPITFFRTHRAAPPSLANSFILNDQEKKQLNALYAMEIKQPSWKLVYQASRDGTAASDFHRKCASIGPNLVVIQSTNGYKFGGFSPVGWSPENVGEMKVRGSVSLFSLKTPSETPPQRALRSEPDSKKLMALTRHMYGPCFGPGIHNATIFVASPFDKQKSRCTFDHGDFYHDDPESCFPTSFRVAELEVFELASGDIMGGSKPAQPVVLIGAEEATVAEAGQEY